MSEGPDRIFLNLGDEETTFNEAVFAGWEVTWSDDRIQGVSDE